MYELYYSDEFKVDIRNLDYSIQLRLKKAIQKVLENPTGFKPLQHASNRYRVRFGVFRLLYKVDGNKVILYRFGNRDSVYD
ncbi:MAG TPA: type II toxin-antitoxin system RelE/ParE family toxin [Candidatus Norongarragalinales archaeon]|nr:type II toxin-antitoxin system RelE/ParE family toxin [Candidatus Norongarragalinales archaeon]